MRYQVQLTQVMILISIAAMGAALAEAASPAGTDVRSAIAERRADPKGRTERATEGVQAPHDSSSALAAVNRSDRLNCSTPHVGPIDVDPIDLPTDNLTQSEIAALYEQFLTRVTWVRVPGMAGSSNETQYVAVRVQRYANERMVWRYASVQASNEVRASMPVVIDTPRFMSAETWSNGFEGSVGLTRLHLLGAIHVTFLKPGMSDNGQRSQPCSDGTPDGGAETTRLYLKTVVEFVTGQRQDKWGNDFPSRAFAGREADTANVGLYASSHTGMLALRTLAEYGLDGVTYFVGWENPLQDVYLTSELGIGTNPDEHTLPTEHDNSYAYLSTPRAPVGRTSENVTRSAFVDQWQFSALPEFRRIDLAQVEGPAVVRMTRAYSSVTDFDRSFIQPDHPFVYLRAASGAMPRICSDSSHTQCHQTDESGGSFLTSGKQLTSVHLTVRVCEELGCRSCLPSSFSCSVRKSNGEWRDLWPSYLATPAETGEWKRRAMNGATYEDDGKYHEFNYFDQLASSRNMNRNPLRVMLLFSLIDHGSGVRDKPKTEAAYRNLKRAGAWVRLNPDGDYLELYFSQGRWASYLGDDARLPDNAANIRLSDQQAGKELRSASLHFDENDALASGDVVGYIGNFTKIYQLAGLAEMMDRTRSRRWKDNLGAVIYDGLPPANASTDWDLDNWSASTQIDKQSPISPALTSWGNRLFMAWKADHNSDLFVASSSDGRTWSTSTQLDKQSPASPALAALGNKLIMAWKADHNNNLFVASSSNGRDWSTSTQLDKQSPNSPALASFDGKLYMAWKANHNNNLFVASSSDGISWSVSRELDKQSPVSPALAVLGNKLIMAWKADHNNNLFVASSSNGRDWSTSTQLDKQSPTSPALASLDGKLFMAWKANHNNDLFVAFSSDGTSWSTSAQLDKQSADSPALAPLNDKLFMAWKADHNNDLFVASSSNR